MAEKLSDVAVVVVQGSFQTPLVYARLSEAIRTKGYLTIQPELPTCSDTHNPDFPKRTLSDDSDVVREAIDGLVQQQGKRVVVVMHSYGGLVGSNAISEELSFSYRRSHDLPGGVIHLFYFTAFILGEKQTVLGAFGESPNNDVKPDGRLYIKNGGALLYNDLPTDEAALWESRLIPQSNAVQTTEILRTAYKFVLSTYLVCEDDKAVPTQFQEMFASTAGSQVERCSSGHSPMLSQLNMLVSKIVQALEMAEASS